MNKAMIILVAVFFGAIVLGCPSTRVLLEVPDVVGMTSEVDKDGCDWDWQWDCEESAQQVLWDKGFECYEYWVYQPALWYGTVVATDPQAGSLCPFGTWVDLYCSYDVEDDCGGGDCEDDCKSLPLGGEWVVLTEEMQEVLGVEKAWRVAK